MTELLAMGEQHLHSQSLQTVPRERGPSLNRKSKCYWKAKTVRVHHRQENFFVQINKNLQSLLVASPPVSILPSSSRVMELPIFQQVTQSPRIRMSFPVSFCSKDRAYHCVVIGLKAKVMCILGCELRGCTLPPSCFPECGCGVLCLGPSGQEHQAREAGRQARRSLGP